MSSEEARAIVQDGLRMRKYRREQAVKEARMEKYEREMITACNVNCEGAKLLRQKSEEEKLNREHLEEKRKLQQQEKIQKMERDLKVVGARRTFVLICVGILLVTVWTPFPWWAAIALAAGLAVCVAAYIFRLYVPWDDCCEFRK